MDKIKQKAKKKRRAEQRAVRQAERRELVEKFKDRCKKNGVKSSFKPAEIRRAYDKLQREMTEEAVMMVTIATLWTMRRLYRYGSLRLFRLAGEITVRLSAAGSGERSLAQMSEELKLDARVDMSNYNPTHAKYNVIRSIHIADKLQKEKQELMRSMAYSVMPAQIHAVYYTLFGRGAPARRSKRLERITEEIAGTTYRMIAMQDAEIYINRLKKETGLMIKMDGKFGSARVSQEEHARLRRRIAV